MEAIEFVSPLQQEEKPEPRNEWHRRLLEQVEAEATETALRNILLVCSSRYGLHSGSSSDPCRWVQFNTKGSGIIPDGRRARMFHRNNAGVPESWARRES